jgi:hypothetical protein
MVLIENKKIKFSSRFIIHSSALSDHSSQSAKPEQYFPNTLGAILACKRNRYTIGSTNKRIVKTYTRPPELSVGLSL